MPKIFIVEDEELLSQALTEYLRERGYATEVAHDGEEALRILPSVRPDLIILDLILPKMSGVDFLKKIREGDSEFRLTPVIVISNLSGDKEHFEQMGLSISAYFTKNTSSLKELTDKIASLLKHE